MNDNESYTFLAIVKDTLLFILTLIMIPTVSSAELIIADHTSTDITRIPQSAIEQAKATLHIAYGHTSHGSQLTTGMTGLVAFADSGGLGLSLPDNIFAWNNGGTDGALDLHDGAMGGDVGYYPQWVNNTRAYLDNPANTDVNVIIWSWCGQVTSKYSAGTLESEYLEPMVQLEADYPDVQFVYMTGHVDIWRDADNKAANQMIRDFCLNNNKILYDFADIERYDPDGTYFEYVNDNCDYYDAGFNRLGNWATEWQNSHVEGVDWYHCSSAHSEPLNANRKAYAAWWLWARIAGWSPNGEEAIQLLLLHNDWNLISISLSPANISIESLLDSILNKYTSVWTYTNQMWQLYDPTAPELSDLNELIPGKGYWINMSNDAELSIDGVPQFIPISLSEGWNLVGYNSPDSQTTSDAISSISSHIVSVWAYKDGQWKAYDPENPGFSDLTLMEPGYGYWINADQACMWSLP